MGYTIFRHTQMLFIECSSSKRDAFHAFRNWLAMSKLSKMSAAYVVFRTKTKFVRSVIHRSSWIILDHLGSSCAPWQCNRRDSWCIHWQSHLVCRDCMVLSSYASGNAGITVAGQDWAVWSTEHSKCPMPDFARLLFLIVGSHFLWVQYHQCGVCVYIYIYI